jgi:hypothetical protein
MTGAAAELEGQRNPVQSPADLGDDRAVTRLERQVGGARERLDASGLADQARRGHARHYAAAIDQIMSGLRGAEEAVWRRRFDAEEDNLRAAVVWGPGRGGGGR